MPLWFFKADTFAARHFASYLFQGGPLRAPPQRTSVVDPEDRSISVPAKTAMTVPPEPRVIYVFPDAREAE